LIVVRPKAKREGRKTLIQTGLRLEADLLGRLRGGGQSLSDEIRDRLNRTFEEDKLDVYTRELRRGLVNIAAKLREDYGAEWYESSRVREAFSVAIVQRIQAYGYLAKEGGAKELFEPHGSPEIIGRIRESDDQHLHSYPLLHSVTHEHAPVSRHIVPAPVNKGKRQ
jgi:hypothetical protein